MARKKEKSGEVKAVITLRGVKREAVKRASDPYSRSAWLGHLRQLAFVEGTPQYARRMHNEYSNGGGIKAFNSGATRFGENPVDRRHRVRRPDAKKA